MQQYLQDVSYKTDADVSGADSGAEGKRPPAHPEDAACGGSECEKDCSLPAEEFITESFPVQ